MNAQIGEGSIHFRQLQSHQTQNPAHAGVREEPQKLLESTTLCLRHN